MSHTDTLASRRRLNDTKLFGLLIVTLFMASRSAWHADDASVAHLLTPLGIVLAAIGGFGRLWCSSYIAGNKVVRLITDGPYSLTRNPLYFFSFIGGLGIAIATETIAIPLLFAAWFAWYYPSVIAKEESLLLATYGESFHAYQASVPRFWPKGFQYSEPSAWQISPAAFRRSLIEVVWFVIAAVIVHVLHDLRDTLAWPTIVSLY